MSLRFRSDQRDVGAGDRRCARAAISLQHIAVERDGALAQGAAIDAGAQRPTDETLDFERPSALFAARGFAIAAAVGGARQHAVFGRDPTLALAAHEARHLVVDAGVAQHAGFAERHQHRALGVEGVRPFDPDRTQLLGSTATGAGDAHADVACWKARKFSIGVAHDRLKPGSMPLDRAQGARRCEIPRRHDWRRPFDCGFRG